MTTTTLNPVARLFEFEVAATERGRSRTLRTTVASAAEARARAEAYGLTVVSVTNTGAVSVRPVVPVVPVVPVAAGRPTLAYASGDRREPSTLVKTLKVIGRVLLVLLMVALIVFVIAAIVSGEDVPSFGLWGGGGGSKKATKGEAVPDGAAE